MYKIPERKWEGLERGKWKELQGCQEHKAQEGRETEIGNPQEPAAEEDYWKLDKTTRTWKEAPDPGGREEKKNGT